MDQERNTNSIFVFISGFILSVLISSFVHISIVVGFFIVFVGSIVLVIEKIWSRSVSKEVLFLSLLLISFGLGAVRYFMKDFHEPLTPSSTGIVINEPEQKENSTSFVLLSDNGEKLLVGTDLYSSVQYGDRVEVDGKLQEPSVIDDGTGRPFDYAKFLAKDDIYFTMSFTKVEIVSRGNGNFIKSKLFRLKNSFIGKVREIFAEPESSLLSGLIVAGKGAMPKDILEEFRRAGVIHIVVLSGYNITIIADFMRKIFENIFIWSKMGVRPQLAAGASIFGIILFVLMTGAEATVVRAALMVLVVIGAKMFGRNYSAPRALVAAAFLMIVHNPKILVFDPSFQLSFLATSGLIFLSPLVEKHLKWLSDKWGARTMLSTTIATQITVLPFLIYSMGNVSLVSLPANILILLTIPFTMLTGFVATLVAYISSALALPLSFVAHLLLAWTLGVSHYLGNLSFASVSVPPLS
ncbi:MAG: ComEC/Rec2 family competence protein, partial [Minisyncoccia bacterium]